MAVGATHLAWTANWNAPWLALLAINFTAAPLNRHEPINYYGEQKFCAGAFVGKQWILTATSCFKHLQHFPQPDEVTVMTGWGSYDCTRKGQWGFKTLAAEIITCPPDEGGKSCDLMMVRARRTAFRVPPAEIGAASSRVVGGGDRCRLLSFDGHRTSPRPGTEYWTPEPGFVHTTTMTCPVTEDGVMNRNLICAAPNTILTSANTLLVSPERVGGVLQCGHRLVGVLADLPSEGNCVREVIDEKVQLYEDVAQHRAWIKRTIEEAYDFLRDEGPPPGWVPPPLMTSSNVTNDNKTNGEAMPNNSQSADKPRFSNVFGFWSLCAFWFICGITLVYSLIHFLFDHPCE